MLGQMGGHRTTVIEGKPEVVPVSQSEIKNMHSIDQIRHTRGRPVKPSCQPRSCVVGSQKLVEPGHLPSATVVVTHCRPLWCSDPDNFSSCSFQVVYCPCPMCLRIAPYLHACMPTCLPAMTLPPRAITCFLSSFI